MPASPRDFTKEVAKEILSQIVWSYWPYWGAPLMSAVLGIIGGYSYLIIYMSMLGAFALVALGLNQLSQWLAEQVTVDKVHFAVPFVGVALNDESNPATLRGIKLGVVLRNSANFPVEVRIDKLETKILDRIPPDDFYVRSAEVAPKDGIAFNNAAIELSDIDLSNKLIYGRISASVSYGRPGKLKHQAEKLWHLAIKFDQNGAVSGIDPSLNEFNHEVVKKLP